jgi:hypothetical protein
MSGFFFFSDENETFFLVCGHLNPEEVPTRRAGHFDPHLAAAFRNPHTMSSCVTPGGVRRIRESIDGSMSDVSVQVRPARLPKER